MHFHYQRDTPPCSLLLSFRITRESFSHWVALIIIILLLVFLCRFYLLSGR